MAILYGVGADLDHPVPWRRERLKHDIRKKFGTSALKPSANIDRPSRSHFYMSIGRGEHQARLASVSAQIDDDLHPAVIDCNSESIWRFDAALSEDCLVVELGQRIGAVHPWLAVARGNSHGSANPIARA